MAKFTAMDPKDVALGRGRAAAAAKEPYKKALQASDAGRIEIERAEKPATVKRYLSEAAHEIGVKVRSSWEDPKQQRVLLWKKAKR
ncbi:MAG: hypothetical protein O3B31_07340 [Chloroflexi bacterium]|nr:hypothetical protein [Chloroflexota bacterium]